MNLGLKYLNPNATYAVEIRTHYDKAPTKEMTGSDPARLQIQLSDAPGSALVFYMRK